MSAIEKLGREKLLVLTKNFAKNWLAHDGLWFQAVERAHGIEHAIELDAQAWSRFSPIEAKRIKEYSEIYENPYCGAERGYIDDVIMPSDTRKVINRALDMLENKNKDNKAFKARPWRKYSNINL